LPDEQAVQAHLGKGSRVEGKLTFEGSVKIDGHVEGEIVAQEAVIVGDGAVIGARAVVTKNVEPYSIVAGNPARLIGKRFDEETIRKLVEICWWDWPIEKINKNINIIASYNVSELLQLT
jgi:UDP-3-O-[3-hydroxymyristoyl] glucosamine N-acyltransferase